MLLGCSKDEDTRIFTLTVNAIPPEGGTVTIGTAQVTTNEYKYGDTANANAKVSDGYFFSHWSANTFIHKMNPKTKPVKKENISFIHGLKYVVCTLLIRLKTRIQNRCLQSIILIHLRQEFLEYLQ